MKQSEGRQHCACRARTTAAARALPRPTGSPSSSREASSRSDRGLEWVPELPRDRTFGPARPQR